MLLTCSSGFGDSFSQCAVQVRLHWIMRHNWRGWTNKRRLGWIRWWVQWRPHNWPCCTTNTKTIISNSQLTNITVCYVQA